MAPPPLRKRLDGLRLGRVARVILAALHQHRDRNGLPVGWIFSTATGVDPQNATRAQVESWRHTVTRLTNSGLVSRTERVWMSPGRLRLLFCVFLKLTRWGSQVCNEIAADLAGDRSIRWDVVCKRIERRRKSRSQKQKRQRTTSAIEKTLSEIRRLERERDAAAKIEDYERAIQIRNKLDELMKFTEGQEHSGP